MNTKRLSWTLILVLITCGILTAAKVNVDWDKQASFTGYKTYAWEKGTPARNPLMDQRITEAIDAELSAKGLQKVELSQTPDLVVLYHAAVNVEQQLNTTSMGGGWGAHWGGNGMSTTTVEKIPVGQLVVDIGDAKTKKLLWLGKASDTLGDNPEKNTKKINEVVKKMFEKFPPPPGK